MYHSIFACNKVSGQSTLVVSDCASDSSTCLHFYLSQNLSQTEVSVTHKYLLLSAKSLNQDLAFILSRFTKRVINQNVSWITCNSGDDSHNFIKGETEFVCWRMAAFFPSKVMLVPLA